MQRQPHGLEQVYLVVDEYISKTRVPFHNVSNLRPVCLIQRSFGLFRHWLVHLNLFLNHRVPSCGHQSAAFAERLEASMRDRRSSLAITRAVVAAPLKSSDTHCGRNDSVASISEASVTPSRRSALSTRSAPNRCNRVARFDCSFSPSSEKGTTRAATPDLMMSSAVL